MEATRTYYKSETQDGGGTSAQGVATLISETTVNMGDEIRSEQDSMKRGKIKKVWASSHDLLWSTGIQASWSRVPVTSPSH